MLKIRLQRTGRKHEPTFRIVVTESQNSTKSGKTLEVLGSYDPRTSNETIKADRVTHWMSKGAQASGTIHNLLVNHKIIDTKKINVLPKKTVAKKEEAPATESPAVEAENPAESAAPAEEPAAETETETVA